MSSLQCEVQFIGLSTCVGRAGHREYHMHGRAQGHFIKKTGQVTLWMIEGRASRTYPWAALRWHETVSWIYSTMLASKTILESRTWCCTSTGTTF